MTAPVPPGDREALAEWLTDAIATAGDPSSYVQGAVSDVTLDGHFNLTEVADAILARWRLVPVEQEPAPHLHRWEEISTSEQIENGAHVFTCGGMHGCGKNNIGYDRA